ncbi:hypothetical protein MASR2M47_08620 [Draconibacterium sp.]
MDKSNVTKLLTMQDRIFTGFSLTENGYPAATGIGMNCGGIIIEFLAVQSDDLKSFPINNPSQIAAHTYSKNVLAGEECMLKTTPKFERAAISNYSAKN